jgi:hypothetical protein
MKNKENACIHPAPKNLKRLVECIGLDPWKNNITVISEAIMQASKRPQG